MADIEYLYATGRLVQGSVFGLKPVEHEGVQKLGKDGAPLMQNFIGVAVPKNDPAMLATQERVKAIALSGFPGGETEWPTFAWKRTDGDQPPYNTRIGFPGHWIYRFTTGFQYPAYTKGGASQIVDPEQIKCGYFIRVVFTCKPNMSKKKPGVYLNTVLVELIGYGEEINNGPDAAALLGAAGTAALPAGASATPVAGGAPIQPPATQTPPPNPAAQIPPGDRAFPMPNTQAPPTPPAPITPAPDFLTPPVLTEKAAGMSYQQFIDQGWTDELLKQHGYMA